MTDTVVHLRCNATGKIRREDRAGRKTIILPSFAAKADTILNEILYPRDELERSIAGLDRTPAPLGHPTINGDFVSAMDPEALARNYVFAWNEKPRWDGDRVALDVVIDEARAGESDEGKRLLDAINSGKPISTSTGLMCLRGEPIANTHTSVARSIVWDHVAILLDEKPAIGTDQGVGIFVNAKSGTKTEVINSTLSEDADQQIDWAIDSLVRAVARREQVPLLERIKSSILGLIRGGMDEPTTVITPAVNTETENMAVTDEQFKDLQGKVDGMDKAIADAVAAGITNALAPLMAQTEALTNAAKQADDAELTDLRARIVNANLMDAADADELTIKAARALANKAAPKPAYGLFNGVATGDQPQYDLPA